VAEEDEALMGKLFRAAARIAREKGFAERGWRAVVNVNKDAHQLVFHVHLHLLAGRPFQWPPG
jgi:histidine triad (HIT) family protein